MYIRSCSQPTAARAPSRELGISFAMRAPPFRASASGSRTYSKKARLSIKTRQLFCDGPLYGSMHSGQGDVVGAFVRVLVEG